MKTIKRLGSMMLAVLLLFTTVFVLFPERAHALFDQTKASQYYITVMIADPDNATCCTNSEGYIVITTKKQNGQDGPVWWAKVNAEDWDVEDGVAYYTYGCNGKQTRDQAAKNVKPIEGFPTEIKFLKSKDPNSTDYIQCNNWFHNTIVNIGVYVSCDPGYVNNNRHAVYTGHEEVKIHGYFTKKKTIDYANKKPRPVSCTFIEGPSEIRIPKSGTASYQYSVNVYDQYYVKWYDNNDGTNWSLNTGLTSKHVSVDKKGKLTISADAAYYGNIGEDFEMILYSGLMWETQTSMPNCRMYITVKPPLFDYVYRDVNGNVDSTRRGGSVKIGYNMNNFWHSVPDPTLPNENPNHYRFVRWEKYPAEKTVYQDFYFKPLFETTHVWDQTSSVGRSCTKTQTRNYKCRYCSETRTETVPASGHVWARGDYANGKVTLSCQYCNAHETYDVPAANRPSEEGLTAVCGSTLSEVSLPSGWRWSNPSQTVGNVGTNNKVALYNYRNSDNVMVLLPVNVTPATLDSSLVLNNWTYGNRANTPVVTGNTVNAPVSFLYKPLGAADSQYSSQVPVNAGRYTVKAVFGQSGNYNVASSTADFEILKRAVTVKADDTSKVFNTSDPSLTATVKGLAEGDTPDVIRYALSRSAGEAEGTYAITPSGAAVQGNYAVTYETGTFKIVPTTKYPATVVKGSGSGNYEEGVTVSVKADPPAAGMVFDRWVSDDVTFADATAVNTTFKMTAKSATVTATYVKEKTDPVLTDQIVSVDGLVYDGTAKALVSPGKATGGTVLYALGTSAGATELYSESVPLRTDAGTYYIWYKVKGDNDHKDLAPRCVTAIIAKRDITVNGIKAMDKHYDGDEKAVLNFKEAVLNGKVGSDELTVTATGLFSDATPGDKKTVLITGLKLGGKDAKNYKLAANGQQTSAVATIAANDLNIVATDYNGEYDGQSHSIFAYSELSGVKITYSETENGTYSEKSPEYTEPGHYIVYFKAEKEGEDPVYGAKTINIEKKDLSSPKSAETAVVDELAYDGTPKKPEITEKVGNTTLTDGVDYEITYEGIWPTVYERSAEPPTQGGEYKAIISYKGNYTGEKEVSFTVNGDPEQAEREAQAEKPKPVDPAEEQADPDNPAEEVPDKPAPAEPYKVISTEGLDAVKKAVSADEEPGSEVELELNVSPKGEFFASAGKMPENKVISRLIEEKYANEPDVRVDSFDVSILKLIGGVERGNLTETGEAIEVGMGYDFAGKKNLSVTRDHETDGENFTTVLTELSEKPSAPYPDNSFYADRINNRMYLYSSLYSTYSVIYSAYTEEASAPAEPVIPDVKVYRLFNPKTGAHFYTANKAEYESLIKASYDDEGIAWSVPERSSAPVYRTFDAQRTGEHVFTLSKAEKEELVAKGWTDEGIAFYADESKTRAVHRLVDERTGISHYTADEGEIKALIAAGWTDEGVTFNVR